MNVQSAALGHHTWWGLLKVEEVDVKTKVLVLTTCLFLAVSIMYAETLLETSLPEKRDAAATPNNTNPPPDPALINDLDKVIQQRS